MYTLLPYPTRSRARLQGPRRVSAFNTNARLSDLGNPPRLVTIAFAVATRGLARVHRRPNVISRRRGANRQRASGPVPQRPSPRRLPRECDRAACRYGVTAMPRLQRRRRATATPGCDSGTFPRLLRAVGVAGSHDCRRGKGIARPEQQREPKQSWRARATRAWMSAIATARQVCWAADSEQAQSRLASARAVPRDRCDLDHTAVAWPGVAVISSLPAHALLPIVQSECVIWVDAGFRNAVAERRSGATHRALSRGHKPDLAHDRRAAPYTQDRRARTIRPAWPSVRARAGARARAPASL